MSLIFTHVIFTKKCHHFNENNCQISAFRMYKLMNIMLQYLFRKFQFLTFFKIKQSKTYWFLCCLITSLFIIGQIFDLLNYISYRHTCMLELIISYKHYHYRKFNKNRYHILEIIYECCRKIMYQAPVPQIISY